MFGTESVVVVFEKLEIGGVFGFVVFTPLDAFHFGNEVFRVFRGVVGLCRFTG